MIQYKNFLIKREQSRAGSRFAECEKSRLKAKLMMTLALLLTAVTGAWAAEPTIYTTAVDMTSLKVGDILAEGFRPLMAHTIQSTRTAMSATPGW